MKLLALTCGRKMANCEILTKEALMGAEELGAEVEIIRMLDLEIHHCNICWPCPAMMKGYSSCIHKDDGPFLFEKIMDCDALLISAPVYSLTPPGYLIAIRDRILGNKVDVASLAEVKKSQGKDERFDFTFHVDDRIFKKRVGAFISVGGAVSHDWVTLSLPLLYTMVFPMEIKVVDQMQVCGVADDGAITLKENELQKARDLGMNIVKASKQPYDSVKFVGEDKGVCPVCHCKAIVIDDDGSIICASCGVRGTLKIEGNKVIPIFLPEEQDKSHLFLEGKKIHHFEVGNVIKELDPYKEKIPELSKKYASYKSPVIPPSKQKKDK
ncbi:MAG: NAD(P)H-dependent oxidoreductase [Dehalococcoidales bacterium]|nr:NAD(P)H-dependent oxidoreductase [Dehalococcoidales bacterium]